MKNWSLLRSIKVYKDTKLPFFLVDYVLAVFSYVLGKFFVENNDHKYS